MEELVISWLKKPITLINVNSNKPVTLMVKCVHEGSSRLPYHYSRLNVTHSGEREQTEVILLSLNYSPFLNIIKYWSQRNLFLMEDYLRTCSSATRSIAHNPKSIPLWKICKIASFILSRDNLHPWGIGYSCFSLRSNVNTKEKKKLQRVSQTVTA